MIVQEKHLNYSLRPLQTEIAVFFMEHHFYFLKEHLTDKLDLFALKYLAGISSKMNEVSLSL